MDGSAYRRLSVGKIVGFAIFGMVCAAGGVIGGLIYIAWLAFHHVIVIIH